MLAGERKRPSILILGSSGFVAYDVIVNNSTIHKHFSQRRVVAVAAL